MGIRATTRLALALALIGAATFGIAGKAIAQDEGARQSWTVYSDNLPRPADEPIPDLLTDPELLSAYVDEHIGGKMADENLVGAVFMAIKNGEVVLQKGYGVKDLDTQEPIDPETSMFYVASISKTFLGTAAMRLVNSGRASLDQPISELAPSIKIDRNTVYKDDPVTLRDTLTHRTGFRDILMNSTAPNEQKWERIRPAIKKYLNKQGAAPDEFYYYCNICISMAAASIEDVSGQFYEDFLEDEVFKPLGIKYGALVIPGSERVAELDAQKTFVTPYVYNAKTDEYDTYGRFIRVLYPPSLVAVSANGIKNYMLMHMNGGLHNGEPFLSPEAFAEMHRHQGSNHPKIPGYRITFKEGRRNGVDYYGHSGDYRGNDSTMQFLPDYDFAFFLSYTGDNDTFYREFINGFIDTAFPRQKETVYAGDDTKQDLERFEGSYTNFRYDEPTPMAFVWPLFGQFEVFAEDGGTLRIEFPSFYFKGGVARYVQTDEKNLFRKIDSGEPDRIGDLLVDYLLFSTDEDGQGTAIASNLQNHSFVLTRIPAWYNTANFAKLSKFMNLGLMAILISFGLIAIARLVMQFVMKRSLDQRFLTSAAVWSAVIAAGAAIIFINQFMHIIFTTLPVNLSYGLDDLGMNPFFALPLISVGLVGVSAILAMRAWIGNELSISTKAVLTAALAPLFVWAFIAFNTNLLTYYL